MNVLQYKNTHFYFAEIIKIEIFTFIALILADMPEGLGLLTQV